MKSKVVFSTEQHGEICAIDSNGPFVWLPKQQLNLEYSDGEHSISGIFTILNVTQSWSYIVPDKEYMLPEVLVTYNVELHQLANFTEVFGTETELEEKAS